MYYIMKFTGLFLTLMKAYLSYECEFEPLLYQRWFEYNTMYQLILDVIVKHTDPEPLPVHTLVVIVLSLEMVDL